MTFACLTAGCAADIVGTGDARRIDPPSSGEGGGVSSGSGSGSATEPGEPGTASGAPAEIEALFAPPEDETVTPDSLFGVWASSSGGVEDRLEVTKNSLTLAKKCTPDGRIAYVTAKIRINQGSITVLESKSAQLPYLPSSTKGTCSFSIQLEVEEYEECPDAYAYDCFRVEGTKLTGLDLPSAYSTDAWIKLSD